MYWTCVRTSDVAGHQVGDQVQLRCTSELFCSCSLTTCSNPASMSISGQPPPPARNPLGPDQMKVTLLKKYRLQLLPPPSGSAQLLPEMNVSGFIQLWGTDPKLLEFCSKTGSGNLEGRSQLWQERTTLAQPGALRQDEHVDP